MSNTDSTQNASSEAFSFSIKPILEAEKSVAAALVQQSLEKANQNAGKNLYPSSEAETLAFLETVSECYGAYDASGNLMGVIAIEEDAVERIAVEPALWRRGIGRKLMAFARTKFGAEYADIFEENAGALQFFEALGMSMFDETAPEPGDLLAENPHKIIHLMY